MIDKSSSTEQASVATHFPVDLLSQAERILTIARQQGLRIATAESCTGGLVCGVLTEIPGSSDVVEGGFITYSNDAKRTSIGVPADLLASQGAVSELVARAMAEGALAHLPTADVAVAITGVAGPGGGSTTKPVGLVHFAAARRGQTTRHTVHHFADTGRTAIRRQAVIVALTLLEQIMTTSTTA